MLILHSSVDRTNTVQYSRAYKVTVAVAVAVSVNITFERTESA